MAEYIVVTLLGEGYLTDGVRFPDAQAAADHGLSRAGSRAGSNAFLVGKLEGQELLALGWMEEMVSDRDELLEMAIGFDLEAMARRRANRVAEQLGFRTRKRSTSIMVGPLLSPMLPAGIRPGRVVVLSGDSGVGVTSLTYLIATYAARFGHVAWMPAPAEVSPSALRNLGLWLKSANDNLYTEPLDSAARAAEVIAVDQPVMCVIDRFLDVMGHRHATQDANFDKLANAARKYGTIVWINDGQDRRGIPFGLGRRLDDIDYLLRLTRPAPDEINYRMLTLLDVPTGEAGQRDISLYYDNDGIHRLQ
ncbi:hypothetical protein [Mycobacteroides abscessus]|uniref:hypothetical protein n=1 Tax=Mycobacteroides abscessus TaxID=36809 RepID=UPI0010439A28|nr:hypothetical protein [Mycobacteroides abscessus]